MLKMLFMLEIFFNRTRATERFIAISDPKIIQSVSQNRMWNLILRGLALSGERMNYTHYSLAAVTLGVSMLLFLYKTMAL